MTQLLQAHSKCCTNTSPCHQPQVSPFLPCHHQGTAGKKFTSLEAQPVRAAAATANPSGTHVSRGGVAQVTGSKSLGGEVGWWLVGVESGLEAWRSGFWPPLGPCADPAGNGPCVWTLVPHKVAGRGQQQERALQAGRAEPVTAPVFQWRPVGWAGQRCPGQPFTVMETAYIHALG